MKSNKHTPKRVKHYIYNSAALSLQGKLASAGLSPAARSMRQRLKASRYAYNYGASTETMSYLISLDLASLELRIASLYKESI